MEEIAKQITAGLLIFEKELYKSVKGNKAAARRTRKASVALEKLLKEFRKVSIQELKHA